MQQKAGIEYAAEELVRLEEALKYALSQVPELFLWFIKLICHGSH